jgi:ABC-type phosphate transport system substrate-binding protein
MRLRFTSTWLIIAAGLLTSNAHAQKGNYKGSAKTRLPVNNAPSTPAPLPAVSRTADAEKGYEIEGASGIAGLKKYPRVNGSTSTIPIGQLLIAKALGLQAELRRVQGGRFSSTENSGTLTATFPLDTNPERFAAYTQLLHRMTHQQTHDAYVALAHGTSDVILVAREPSNDELALATQTRIAFDVRPIALDAFVFIANSQNEIAGLTLEQIRAIYGGRVKNWKDVGGADMEIYSVTRGANSGSLELMKKLVMHDLGMIQGGWRMASTMVGTLDKVAQRKDALAYSVYYYERVMNPRPEIKPLAVDGVLPTSQTIADRSYPLVEPVYVVTRKDITPDGPAAILRDWLLSSDGQKLIAQSGYVP